VQSGAFFAVWKSMFRTCSCLVTIGFHDEDDDDVGYDVDDVNDDDDNDQCGTYFMSFLFSFVVMYGTFKLNVWKIQGLICECQVHSCLFFYPCPLLFSLRLSFCLFNNQILFYVVFFRCVYVFGFIGSHKPNRPLCLFQLCFGKIKSQPKFMFLYW
jgi:hypothetical protein